MRGEDYTDFKDLWAIHAITNNTFFSVLYIFLPKFEKKKKFELRKINFVKMYVA